MSTTTVVTVGLIQSKFAAAFSPNPLLEDFFLGVIERWYQLQSSSRSTFFGETKDATLRKFNDKFSDFQNRPPENVDANYTSSEARTAAKRALRGLWVLLAHYEQLDSNLILSEDQFLEKYSEFARIEDQYLLSFRNFLAVALTVEKAEGNKNVLIEICARLSEGATAKKYITGGGTRSGSETPTSRRLLVFEEESGTKTKPRPERRMKDARTVSPATTACDESTLSAASGSLKRPRPSYAAGFSKKARNELTSDDDSVVSELSFQPLQRVAEEEGSASAQPSVRVPDADCMLDPNSDLRGATPPSWFSAPVAATIDLDSFEFDTSLFESDKDWKITVPGWDAEHLIGY
jgi:hypothetical protein